METIIDFQVTKSLVRQNSFGIVNKGKNIELDVQIGIHEDGGSGWFEFYDVESGGEDWYAEGCLIFDEDKNLTDYDGVFELSDFILDKLEELGFNVDDMR